MNLKAILYEFSRPLLLVLLFALFSVLAPSFWRPNNWANVSNIVFSQSPFLILMSLAMTLSIIVKGIDLSIGSAVAMITCLAGIVLNVTYNPLLGILTGLAAGMCVGAVNGLLIAKVKVSPFIATYSMQWVLRGVAMLIMGGKSVYDLGPDFSDIFIGSRYTMLVITAVIVFLVSMTLRFTVFGHNIYSTGINAEAARISGIKTDKVVLFTYIISGFLIGLTSVMYTAYLKSAEPVIGGSFPIQAIAASLVGGASMGGGNGKVSHAVVGTFIMLVLTSGMIIIGVPNVWQDLVTGAVILMAILMERGMRKLATDLE